jgi:LuxR family transcriptional regulator, maltose regulon positive regulatory protein
MVDYLQSELLAQLPAEQVTFLTRTAVLERMCRPLCDAVLGTTGSGRFLESLERSNLLLVPLDRRREWYRYHQLFRQFLLAELERREPELIAELHARAAAWYEANGLPDVAVDHAQAAGDADQVARLVATWAQPAYAGGRVETVQRWFGWFEERALVERYPLVAALGAFTQALVGRPAAAERWAAAAEGGTGAARAVQAPPDGSTLDSYLALLRGLLCRDGIDRMRADANAALAGLHRASPWRVTALLLAGVADALDGRGDRADPADRADRADALLARAVEAGLHTGALPAASTALAERCLLAIQRKDWGLADTLAGQAVATLADGHLDDYVMSPLVHAAAAHTALHRGDVPRARDHLARAARLRPLLTHAIPALAVQTLLELGMAYLAVDDLAGARAVLRQARDVLQQRPDVGVLRGQLRDLRARLDTARVALPGASSLTTAELRLLPLLATHLTFREVGQRLYISQHTVKTQAMSIYRKLGVSSRARAVQRVQEIGLLAR